MAKTVKMIVFMKVGYPSSKQFQSSLALHNSFVFYVTTQCRALAGRGAVGLCSTESSRDLGSFHLVALKPSRPWGPPLYLLHSAGRLEKWEGVCMERFRDQAWSCTLHPTFYRPELCQMAPSKCKGGWRCSLTLRKKGVWWIFSITSVAVALECLKFEKNYSKGWSPNASGWHTEAYDPGCLSHGSTREQLWTPQEKEPITGIRLSTIVGAGRGVYSMVLSCST